MKKVFKYICLAGLIGIMSSCVDDSLHSKDILDSGDGVKLTVSLSIPQMQSMQTRGVLDDTNLNPQTPTVDYLKSLNLYMFIFENTGSQESNYLLTLVHGDRISVTSTEQEPETGQHPKQILQTFTAVVEGTSENAIIHLVATADPNFEEQLQNSTDRTELGLFYGSNGLYTKDTYPAFWKRIDLGMPITKENAENEEFMAKLRHVQMIRNFCRVTVNIDEEYANPLGFVIDGYALINQVNAAYVAAYSDSDPRGFVEFEASDESGKLTGKMKSYGDILTEDKYNPARHPESVRAYKEEEASKWLPAEGADDSGIFSSAPKYMFERPHQDQHHTFVIIKGHFEDSEGYRYIKLDIGDIPEWMFDEEDGFYLSSAFEYRHLYRNFSYNISITTIASKDVGAATAAGAVSGPAVNNVGATVETQSITDISDGVDRMFVNETKFVIVDDDYGNPYPASFDLLWRYVSDWQRAKVNDTQYIKCDYPGKELEPDDASGIFGNLTPLDNEWPDGWELDEFGDWSGKRIFFKKPDETVRQKTVRLYYSNPSTQKPNVRLSRDITFVMRKRWEFVTDDSYPSNVEVYPGAYSYENNTMPYESLAEMRENITPGYVGSQIGAQLTVMFELPNDLPESLFPLDFRIGFDRQNVENAYVGNAVVTTGPSMFDDDPGGVDVMRMQFIKTVTWDYYHGSGDAGDKGHKIVTARFITTNDVLYEPGLDDVSATTRVRVTNPYFTLGADDFERAAHDDVVDPTRTRYYWNFSYPEWGTYFTNYGSHADTANIYYDFITIFDDPNKEDAAAKNEHWNSWSETHGNPHTLNNLYFAGYERGSSLGTYIKVLADGDGVTRSKDNAELWFNLNHTSDTGFNINMKIQATNTSTRTGGNNDRKYYDRDVTVLFKTTTADGTEKEYSKTVRTTTPSGGGTLVMETLNYDFSADIPAGETITRVLVWSVQADCHTTNNNNDVDLPSATRYYSIELNITPKE